MKRSFFVAAFLVATSLAAPLHSFAATTAKPVVATEAKEVTTAASPKDATTAAENKVEYTLAYPGMLADNPLYFLKQFRDWVMDLLIADPLRKIDFYVLQSDKQLNAATFLNAKAKADLAANAVGESTQFMQKAFTATEAMKSQGKEVPAFVLEKMQKSVAKHEEVLTDLLGNAGGAQKAAFSGALEALNTFETDLSKLK